MLIKLDEDQELKYSYLAAFLKLEENLKKHVSSKKITLEEYLEGLDQFFEELQNFATDNYLQLLLLGDVRIPAPDEFDYWTDEEKDLLVKRWSIIDNLINYSSIGNLDYDDDEDEFEFIKNEPKLLN